jgi:hypothetical protein
MLQQHPLLTYISITIPAAADHNINNSCTQFTNVEKVASCNPHSAVPSDIVICKPAARSYTTHAGSKRLRSGSAIDAGQDSIVQPI